MSGRVSVVLSDHAAEAVVSTDLADGRRRGRHARLWRLLCERAMRPLRVVVLDVLAQDAFEVAAVEDQQPVQAWVRMVRTNRSAMAFACGDRTGVFTIRMPSVPNTSSKAPLYLLSRS